MNSSIEKARSSGIIRSNIRAPVEIEQQIKEIQNLAQTINLAQRGGYASRKGRRKKSKSPLMT